MGDASADHATHDRLLVAEAADRGGRLPADLAACPDCQVLHADLITLAAAVPLAAMPARLRDFQLTPADADRLRPAGWRRWLAAIGTSRDAVTRPLALGLTTLGLAGLLVATVPAALPFGGATAGAPDALETVGGAAVGEAAGGAASQDPGDDTIRLEAAPSAAPEAAGGAPIDRGHGVASGPSQPAAPVRTPATAPSTAPPLMLVSGALLVAGGGLFLLRRLAPRVGRAR